MDRRTRRSKWKLRRINSRNRLTMTLLSQRFESKLDLAAAKSMIRSKILAWMQQTRPLSICRTRAEEQSSNRQCLTPRLLWNSMNKHRQINSSMHLMRTWHRKKPMKMIRSLWRIETWMTRSTTTETQSLTRKTMVSTRQRSTLDCLNTPWIVMFSPSWCPYSMI